MNMIKRNSKKRSKFRRWTKEEIRIVLKYYHQLTYRQLARKVKRSPKAIRLKSLEFGLQKAKKTWWTEVEIKRLKELYRNHSSKDVAHRMKRTVRSVEIKAFKLGLKKTRKYMRNRGSVKI